MRDVAVALLWLLVTACSNHDASRPSSRPRAQGSGDAGDKTIMFIEIEGTLAELAALRGIDGLEMERGASDIGGRHRIGAMVTRKGALLDIHARGLETRVVMDEAEAQRRMQVEREEIEKARD